MKSISQSTSWKIAVPVSGLIVLLVVIFYPQTCEQKTLALQQETVLLENNFDPEKCEELLEKYDDLFDQCAIQLEDLDCS